MSPVTLFTGKGRRFCFGPCRVNHPLGVCPGNPKIGDLGGSKTIHEPLIVDPGAFCEFYFCRATLLGQAPRDDFTGSGHLGRSGNGQDVIPTYI